MKSAQVELGVYYCNALQEKSWIMHLAPFDRILEESDEEDEEIYDDRWTEE